jgi:hypothetical protein
MLDRLLKRELHNILLTLPAKNTVKVQLPLTICLAFSHKAFGASREEEADIGQDYHETPFLRRNMQWHGHGNGGGGNGRGGGRNGNGGMNSENMKLIHKLFDHRDQIHRELHYDDDETTILSATTTSDDPDVAQWIKQHVADMKALKESGGRIRNWDPLFHALFDNGNKLNLQVDVEQPGNGVKAWMTADDDAHCAAALAQEHYKTVSAFVENGWDEMHKEHEIPDVCKET